MKKLFTMLIMVLFTVTLTSCVEEANVEPDPIVDDNEDDETVDPNEEENPRMDAPSFIVELIENEITDTYTYYVYSGVISNTKISNIYVGVNEEGLDQLYIYRVIVMGRWDTISYILIIDSDSNTLQGLQIVAHDEQRGDFIELDSFLNQFDNTDIDFYLSNDVSLGIDGDASATTTIEAMNSTIEEIINHYKNNVE